MVSEGVVQRRDIQVSLMEALCGEGVLDVVVSREGRAGSEVVVVVSVGVAGLYESAIGCEVR